MDVSINDGLCKLALEMDFELIGETFKLTAANIDGDVIFERNITVVGFM